MTAGGCAVLAGRRGVERLGQGHVRQTQDAGGVRCGRPQAWRGRCTCLLAEQCAARRQARQYRGSFSGRRRWRFVARLAGKYPRMVEFHNTILHPHAQNLVPQHSGTRISVLPSCSRKLVRTLPLRSRTVSLCSSSTIIGKVVDNCALRLCYGLASAILRSSAKRFRLQSIVTVCLWVPKRQRS